MIGWTKKVHYNSIFSRIDGAEFIHDSFDWEPDENQSEKKSFDNIEPGLNYLIRVNGLISNFWGGNPNI